MLKRLAPLLICLLAATAAVAQPGGGRGAGRGPTAAAKRAPKPLNQLQIVGVIKAIDAPAGRITIAYEPVEPLNWPAGTQPFPVGKSALLDGRTVGEKVRFTLDSGSVTSLAPF